MKSLLGLVQGAPCKIEVDLKDATGGRYKPVALVKNKANDAEELPLYSDKDTVMGEVRLTPTPGRKMEHQGIKIQLIGRIELASERGTRHDFVSLTRELAPPGDLSATRAFPFEFRNVEMQYESYRGIQVRCRYLLKVIVSGKGMTPDAKKETALWVRSYEAPPALAPPIKMEVGIEDCLHIEFEYDKAAYALKDVVVGKIYFLLVRIKLKHMELEIRRRETTGTGAGAHNETETLAKYEIMDGAPVRGEAVPIRLYLTPFDLTPTYASVHNKYSVRYYLNLVLVDEEDRRYFKQHEITLYRRPPAAPGVAGADAGAAAANVAPSLALSPLAQLSPAAGAAAAAAGEGGEAPTPAAAAAGGAGSGTGAVGALGEQLGSDAPPLPPSSLLRASSGGSIS